MMAYVQMNKNQHVTTLTLNKPKANALSTALLKELWNTFSLLETDDETRVIVLRGEGKFFCAGADIKEFTALQKSEDYESLARFGQKLMNKIETYPKPVIAAIHGAALGGGLELAMGCHMRFVAAEARLGLPELTLGIIPGFAGTQRLPRLVGVGKACEMMLTGQSISGSEAVRIGLANEAFEENELFQKVAELAGQMARKSPMTIKAVLHLLQYAKDARYEEGIEEEARKFKEVFGSEDASEGIAAFLEKRKPFFQGE